MHSLAEAQSLVAAGEYDYDDGQSCLRFLLQEFESMVEAVQFVAEAFATITPEDYCCSVRITTAAIQGTYDEYAFVVPEPLVQKYLLRKRNWYLKFKITELRGRKAFILSLHFLNYVEHRRKAGPLSPG